MVFVHKVRTKSGATAVQIAEREGGRDKVLEHLGSAKTDAELSALLEVARGKIYPGLGELGVAHASLRTMFRSLGRAQERGYRDQVAAACFAPRRGAR